MWCDCCTNRCRWRRETKGGNHNIDVVVKLARTTIQPITAPERLGADWLSAQPAWNWKRARNETGYDKQEHPCPSQCDPTDRSFRMAPNYKDPNHSEHAPLQGFSLAEVPVSCGRSTRCQKNPPPIWSVFSHYAERTPVFFFFFFFTLRF